VLQRSFDDLGRPLSDVTFCVLDLETTGGSAATCAITEIGAVKVRAGECIGTFQTLVDPGCAIPPEITVLTGITQMMVRRAPRIASVLPTFLEFLGDAVIVGHNVRFDLSFLAAALGRDQRPLPDNPVVDTCALARRLVRDEVPNCRLDTLASRLRLDHRPSHRALDDALATVDLLHALIERATALGVTGLDDLLALPTMTGHPQAAKLGLTGALPRGPGVYLFRDRCGEILYVGKATNLRARVRSYFSTETRRKIGGLLRETARIDHVACTGTLEASVLEIRLIQRHTPRYNTRDKRSGQPVFVTLTTDRFPRLTITRAPHRDAALSVGPLPSRRHARLVVEALESAVPLRRCTGRVPTVPRAGPCTPAQLGVASCPCSGAIDAPTYARVVERAVRAVQREPELVLEPLAARMQALAAADRFEEAVDVRERAAAFAGALRRQRRIEGLRRAGQLRIEVRGEGGAELLGGRLVRVWPPGPAPDELPFAPPGDEAPPGALADELGCVAAWLDAQAHRVRVVHCAGGLAEPIPALPTFNPRRARIAKEA
jgi:DNA polymerase III subunit epsilon